MNLNGDRAAQSDPSLAGAVKSRSRLTVAIDQKAYTINGEPHCVLSEIKFEVTASQFVCVLGQSGCGKTTLLRLIAGLDTEFDGSITVDGKVIGGQTQESGLVFQEARLLPWMTVEQNIAFALPAKTTLSEARCRVSNALSLVSVTKYKDAWPHQLSGGMEKRVALARAIVNIPKILLLDEPFSALDTITKFALQDELIRIHTSEELTTILVTHDLDEAIYLSDRIILLSRGPAVITQEYFVDLPRPRDRIDATTNQLRAKLYNALVASIQTE